MDAQPPNDCESQLGRVLWRGERVSRVVLGTVQLGMDYGIANHQGKPDEETAKAIVATAWEGGVRHFDTAQAYGESEAVLGRVLGSLGILNEARIESKLSIEMDPADLIEVAESIERTFERLGTDRLWCMMLHRSHWLDWWDEGLGELLKGNRDRGRFQHLGVSINSPSEAARCLAHPDMEVLQVPCNAWDQRPVRLGVVEDAHRNGQLCCVRSIFLQGLLTLSPSEVAKRLPMAREASVRWHDVAEQTGITPVELAVRFAVGLDTPLIVGAESADQVAGTLALARLGPLPRDVKAAIAGSMEPVLDDLILEPWRWES